jgi:ataxia telangiectasia mutated family protein
VELPIRKNGKYLDSDLISVVKWDPKITAVGGINAPKKIEVLCSDGIARSQLLKGRDDMRQDAIMQQIFTVVNQLLMSNKEMSLKQAKICTYRVVPFSRRSGILEWCSATMPIGMYLVGNKDRVGAHQKYRPNDWLPVKAQKLISDNDSKDSDTKIKAFNEICRNLKPVFHKFFYENFKSPGVIFERRFAYTVSVAISSMIGYILGIGDRHVQNILIDMKTAEVIHIDFGIAFEAGKCLPHPELIPFRLTRDMLAPMGVSGVDGLFRKTCEKTIEILRENEKTLMTILEVLLYDPMYTWSIGAKHARARQLEEDAELNSTGGTDENHDSMATRALQRVQSKLKGFADDTSTRYPSIDGQIQYLIQAATDVGHLSKLFRGWQAYL